MLTWTAIFHDNISIPVFTWVAYRIFRSYYRASADEWHAKQVVVGRRERNSQSLYAASQLLPISQSATSNLELKHIDQERGTKQRFESQTMSLV